MPDERVEAWNDAIEAAANLLEAQADAIMANRRSLFDRVMFPSIAGELRDNAEHVRSLKFQ